MDLLPRKYEQHIARKRIPGLLNAIASAENRAVTLPEEKGRAEGHRAQRLRALVAQLLAHQEGEVQPSAPTSAQRRRPATSAEPTDEDVPTPAIPPVTVPASTPSRVAPAPTTAPVPAAAPTSTIAPKVTTAPTLTTGTTPTAAPASTNAPALTSAPVLASTPTPGQTASGARTATPGSPTAQQPELMSPTTSLPAPTPSPQLRRRSTS